MNRDHSLLSKKKSICLILISLMLNASVIAIFNSSDSLPNLIEQDAKSKLNSPISSFYESVSNNGTALNVTATIQGNSSRYESYLPSITDYNYDVDVPESSIINSMNFTIENPQIVTQTTLSVNDSVDIMPSYTILYESSEFITRNATIDIDCESFPSHPLGNISIYVNSSTQLTPEFLLNFTSPETTNTFNITRSDPGDLNITIELYFENSTLYSNESFIVNFYDVENSTINSIAYTIEYTPEVYQNQTGSVMIDCQDGTLAFLGDINATWDSVQKWTFDGDGVHNFDIVNSSLGTHEMNIEFYTIQDSLYANETFSINIIEPTNTSETRDLNGDQFLNVTYNTNANIGDNAEIYINATDTLNFTHTDINITLTGCDCHPTNQTGASDYYFSVTSDVVGDVNIQIDFYNETNDYNVSVPITISFFNGFNESEILGVEYQIKYPAVYYTGYNGTIYVNATDGTNLTIGDIELYYNYLLNQSFSGPGIYENNITSNETGIQNINLVLNYSNDDLIRNESFIITFSENTVPIPDTITKDGALLSSFNKTVTDSSDQFYETLSMEFEITENVNITGFTLYCESKIYSIDGYLNFELHENDFSGELLTSYNHPVVAYNEPGWHFFIFPIDNLEPGQYCLVINGSQLKDFFGINYDYFSWYQASGDSSPHNADNNIIGESARTPLDKDFLMKVEYLSWTDTTFENITINATAGSVEKKFKTIDSTHAYVNFTKADGPWYPREGLTTYSVQFDANTTCKADILCDVNLDTPQFTNISDYYISDTAGNDPIQWTLVYPGDVLSEIIIPNTDITNYESTVHIPQSWYATNATAIGNSEEYSNSKDIVFNSSVADLEWSFEAFSNSITSEIEIADSGNNVMGRGDNLDILGEVAENNILYYANLSIWRDDGLNYTTSVINTSAEFLFDSWLIPADADLGQYEAYYYWCNGTDVAQSSMNFTVKLNADFESVSEYGECYYNHNCSYNFTFVDSFSQDPLNNGQISVNWSAELWSWFLAEDGVYTIKFNTTGLEKGSGKDINISITSETYRDESLVFRLFILVNTSIALSPDYDEMYPVVNQSLQYTITYYTEFHPYGLTNDSDDLYIQATIGGITVPLSIGELFSQYSKSFNIMVNLADFPQYPQVGKFDLEFTAYLKNNSIHYETQTRSIELHIKPQTTEINIQSTSAFFDTDVNHIYEYVGTDTLEVSLNITKETPVGFNLFQTDLVDYANVIAEISGNSLESNITQTLNNEGSGIYSLNLDLSALQENQYYYINITVQESDLENTSAIIEFNLIEKFDLFIDLNRIPDDVSQNNRVPISGTVYIINGTSNVPLSDYNITITIEYSGVAPTYEEVYRLKTSSTGTFSLTNITAPNADDYLLIRIVISVEEGRYFNSEEIIQGSRIYEYPWLSTILIILISLAVGGLIVFIMFRTILRKRSNLSGDFIDAQLSTLKHNKKKSRDVMKSRLDNYIRVPTLDNDQPSTVYGTPKISSDYNLIVIPPDEEETKKYLQPKMLQTAEEEIFNKDLIVFKKERYLNAAIKQEQANNLEKAMEYYEKAAILAEKIGAFSESMVFFKNFERIYSIIEKRYETNKDDNAILNFLRKKFFAKRNQEFIDDMKEKVFEIRKELNPDLNTKSEADSNKIGSSLDKKDRKTKEDFIKKASKEFTPKDITIPLVKKKKYEEEMEMRRLMDDL